jgi:hypothetical protein
LFCRRNPPFRRGYGYRAGAGHLGKLELFDAPQDPGYPKLGGKDIESAPKLVGRQFLGRVVRLGRHEGEAGRELLAPAACQENPIDFPHRDRNQPRAKPTRVLQMPYTLYGIDERLLHDVFELVIPAEQAENHTGQVTRVPVVEHPVCARVASAEALDQVKVIDGRLRRP